MPLLSIDRRTVAEQPFVFVRRTVAPPALAAAIGQCLGQAYAFAGKAGATTTGRPLTRYTAMGDGQMTIESGVSST